MSELEQLPETQNGQTADVARAESTTPELPLSFRPDGLPGAVFGGYDRYSTEKRLAELGELYRALWREQAEKVRQCELEIDRLQEGQRLIGETLVAAEQDRQAITENARRTALELVEAAQKQAAEIREEAELESRAKATELIETAERTRASVLEEAKRAQAFVDDTHSQLGDFLLAAVNWYEQVTPSANGKPEASGRPAGEERLAETAEGSQLDPLGLNGSPDAGIAQHP